MSALPTVLGGDRNLDFAPVVDLAVAVFEAGLAWVGSTDAVDPAGLTGWTLLAGCPRLTAELRLPELVGDAAGYGHAEGGGGEVRRQPRSGADGYPAGWPWSHSRQAYPDLSLPAGEVSMYLRLVSPR